MTPAPRSAVITLRGLVVPADWDSRGRVRQVALLTPDEQEWPIEPSGDGLRLLGRLRREVVVRAVLAGDPPGSTLRVLEHDPVLDGPPERVA